MQEELIIKKLGKINYLDAFDLQRALVIKRQKDEIPDTLLLLEHNPVYTIGKRGSVNHLLANKEQLEAIGAGLHFTNRGGDITFHGPGQIVGYPIIALKNFRYDVKWYVSMLEEGIIQALKELRINASRLDGLTGVWVEDEKICAIGVRVERWVTYHGFALNVNTNLDYFKLIIPCGIANKGVTSIKKIIGHEVDTEKVQDIISDKFCDVFKKRPVFSS